MTGVWVLIVTFVMGMNSSVSSLSVEFYGQERCEAARAALMRQGGAIPVAAVCVKK